MRDSGVDTDDQIELLNDGGAIGKVIQHIEQRDDAIATLPFDLVHAERCELQRKRDAAAALAQHVEHEFGGQRAARVDRVAGAAGPDDADGGATLCPAARSAAASARRALANADRADGQGACGASIPSRSGSDSSGHHRSYSSARACLQ